MPSRLLDPRVVQQLIATGWTVMYGPRMISFHCQQRTIRLFNTGQAEVEDATDVLGAPSPTDPAWAAALAVLGIDPEQLGFNAAACRWTYPADRAFRSA